MKRSRKGLRSLDELICRIEAIDNGGCSPDAYEGNLGRYNGLNTIGGR